MRFDIRITLADEAPSDLVEGPGFFRELVSSFNGANAFHVMPLAF
jgi:hypothetical protein